MPKLRLYILLHFFFYFFISGSASAQTIVVDGKVSDQSNQKPIPYATLGIKGKNIGTVTDENRIFHFSIKADQLSDNDLITVSSIGYRSFLIPVDRFKKAQLNVVLSPSITTLNAVTIKPSKVKTKIYGRTGNSTIMVTTMFTQKQLVDDNLGKEEAAILNIDNDCYLKDFNMYVVANRFKNVKFRLNLYSVKNGIPDSLIVNHNIIFDVSQKRGWVKVDLKPYDIYLSGYDKVAVSIQWLKSEKADSSSRFFTVSATLSPLHAVFFRDKSQAEWKKVGNAYISFNLTADYFNPSKINRKEVKNETEETAQLTDSLKNLINYVKYGEDAAASPYGHNSSAGKYLYLPNTSLYYETYGEGKPLLLLHGNSQSISAFYQQIAGFAKYYQVIVVDTRAQGKSTDSMNIKLTYELFANDMKLLMDSLHLQNANVVGWSDGGITGLIMAMKYPGYINKLAVIGANLFPEGIDNNILIGLKKEYDTKLQNTDSKSVNYERLLRLLIEEPKLKFSDLQKINIPVLVMAGEHDVIKKEHTSEISNSIKNAKLDIIKGATHYAPQEKPQDFNKAVLSFFKD